MSEKLIAANTIRAAHNGDAEAMRKIIRHYQPYIKYCSRRRFFDEYGNRYDFIDDDIRQRIESKLMYQIIYEFDPDRLPEGETLEL